MHERVKYCFVLTRKNFSFDKTCKATVGHNLFFLSKCLHASVSVSIYISLHIGHLCKGAE